MSFKGFTQKVFKKEIEKLLREKVTTSNPEQILSLMKHDIQTNFRHYSFVNHQFSNALNSHKYLTLNTNNQNHSQNTMILKQTLLAMAQYPTFSLDSDTMNYFNRLMTDNIHQKDNELLQNCLLFLIICDPHVQSSPVYIEFVRFYLKDNIELIKSQLSIDLYEENLLNTIKLFFFRIFQRGFLPRQPTYMRQLYIKNHTLLMNKMVGNRALGRSLMIKKVNHQNLMKVKEFYQIQMKESLYHQKNKLLMDNLVQMVPYLCKSFELQIKLIEDECKYLRELYVKLFLVIEKPELRNGIYFYDMVINFGQAANANEGKALDGKEKLLNQYLDKLEMLYGQIESFKLNSQAEQSQEHFELNSLNLSNEELFLIIKNIPTLKLQAQILNQLTTQLAKRILSAIVFKKHLPQIIKIFNLLTQKNIDITAIQNTLSCDSTYEMLDLNQSAQISASSLIISYDNAKIALSKSIQRKDILHVGNQQILNLIQIYLNLALSSPLSDFQHFQRQQTLIKFILRFLSDHHPNLPFDFLFQQILEVIFGIHPSSKPNVSILEKDFNDQDGNYPHNILKELQNHLKKHSWKIKNSTLKNIINHKLNP